MSPALLDSTVPDHRKSNSNGQISTIFSLNFSGFSSIDQSEAMNSSSSNAESSRVSNSNERGFGFGKPAFGSATGRSKPRMVKLRRHAGSGNPRSTETGKIDSGFNPFRPVSDNSIWEMGLGSSGNLKSGNVDNEGFVFGAEKWDANLNYNVGNSSRVVGNKILDDMAKLKIGSEQEFVSSTNPVLNLNVSEREGFSQAEGSDKGLPVFGSAHKRSGIDESAVFKLPEEIRELNIEGPGNVESSKNVKDASSNLSAHNKIHFSFGSGDGVTNSFTTSVASELLNELKKLNIKGAGDVDGGSLNYNADNMNRFVHEGINKAGNSLAGSAASKLPDKMKNLSMKDSMKTYGGVRKEVNFKPKGQIGVVFGSTRGASGSLDGEAESAVSDEMVKLKIASQAGDNAGQRQTGFGSSTFFAGNSEGNLGNTNFQDVRSSIPAEFSFMAGLQGRSLSGSQVPHDNFNDHTKLHCTTASSTFSSSGVHFKPVGNFIEVPSVDRSEKKDEFNFTSSLDGTAMPYVEFTTLNQKGNIFAGLDKKLEFSAKMESAKDARSKKKRGKLKKPASAQQWIGQDFVSSKSSSQEHPDSFESYSPMDVSPYQEILADGKGSRETSVTSEEAFHPYINNASSESRPTAANDGTDEDLVFATQRMNINEGDAKSTETKVEDSEYRFGKGFGAEGPSHESVLGAETESFKTANEQLECSTDSFVTATDTEVSSSLRFERQDSDGRMQFSFASASEDVGGTSFMFAASPSAQGQSSAAMRQTKKKNSVKVVQESYSSTPNIKVPHTSSSMQFFPVPDTTSLLSPRRGQKGDLSTSFSKRGDKTEAVNEQETKQSSAPAASIAAQEACDKWRLRGNQAYANGDMSRAEDYYTQGVNCISETENSKSCLRALMLCYSNRAATRMSLGRMRDALADCMKAAAIDPNFLRVQVRAANCYLVLGEVENASLHFMKCLQSGSEACADRKLVLEASEGVEKAQKVLECMKQSTKRLQRRTSSDAESALGVIAQALTISSYCEKLLEMKADALFMLRKYDELIQLCEQTLGFAEMNYAAISADGHSPNPSVRLWRWRLSIKSYFYLGRLEEAVDFLKKQEESFSTTQESESKTLKSLIPLAGTITDLVRHKTAGNEAFQSGRHAEAVEHYTAALSCTVESRPFAAVCFCNRAAAHKAMGQIVDAIADCSLAIALDGNYLKAISRRATLFEMIRDYDQATMDLERLVSVLLKQVEDKANQSGASDRTSCVNDLRQTQQRLSAMEEEARKEIPLNMYLILGIDPSVTASEIKKAYRKAALRHHPDKAGQSLARSENRDYGLRKEVVEGVHKDADRLFKMIGEAYAVLSDPNKRSRYDLDEEMRNAQKRGNDGSTSRMHSDAQNYPFERSSSSRRQWREVWRSYGNSQSRGSETHGSSRY